MLTSAVAAGVSQKYIRALLLFASVALVLCIMQSLLSESQWYRYLSGRFLHSFV